MIAYSSNVHKVKKSISARFIPPFALFCSLIFVLLICSSVEAAAPHYKRSIASIEVPDVILVNQNGEKVRLKSYLETDQPVVVDFIYATCTTICPVLSAGFVSIQRKLGQDCDNVRLVSISIDPENDDPAVMKKYLDRYRAQPGWVFLTGSRADINTVMAAFDAYFPNKMSHKPLNFIRSPEDGKWIKLFGLISSKELMAEFQNEVEK